MAPPDRTPLLLVHSPAEVTLGGIRSSTAVLINGMIGAGALSLPFICSQLGVSLGSAVIVLMGMLSLSSQKLLIKASMVDDDKRYDTLVRSTFGQKTAALTLIALCINCFGALTAFIQVVSSLLPPVFESRWPSFPLGSPLRWSAVLIGAVVLPLSMFRKPSRLKYSSSIGLLALTFVLVVMIFRLVQPSADQPPHPPWDQHMLAPHLNFKIFTCLAVATQVFACHWMLLPLYADLQRASLRRITRIGRQTTSFATLVYVGFGVVGCLTFGDATEGNILLAFPNTDDVAVAAKAATTVYMLTACPVQVIMLRSFLSSFFWARAETLESMLDTQIGDQQIGDDQHAQQPLPSSQPPPAQPWSDSHAWVLVLSTAILCAASALALSVPDVATIFALTGAVGASSISLLLPGLLFLKMVDGNDEARTGGRALLCEAGDHGGDSMDPFAPLTLSQTLSSRTFVLSPRNRSRRLSQSRHSQSRHSPSLTEPSLGLRGSPVASSVVVTASRWERVQASFLVLVGCVLVIVAPIFIVWDAVTGS